MTLREEIIKNCGLDESFSDIKNYAKDQLTKLKKWLNEPAFSNGDSSAKKEEKPAIKVEPYATYHGSKMFYGLRDTSTDQVYKIFEIDESTKKAKVLKNNFIALCHATNRKCSPGMFENQAMYFRGKGYDVELTSGDNNMY